MPIAEPMTYGITLGYKFREEPAAYPEPAAPPPPPPAPPAPPPPPAPPSAICNKGPYIVFFDWDKSDITPEAASILDSAVTAYGNCANVPVMLAFLFGAPADTARRCDKDQGSAPYTKRATPGLMSAVTGSV